MQFSIESTSQVDPWRGAVINRTCGQGRGDGGKDGGNGDVAEDVRGGLEDEEEEDEEEEDEEEEEEEEEGCVVPLPSGVVDTVERAVGACVLVTLTSE